MAPSHHTRPLVRGVPLGRRGSRERAGRRRNVFVCLPAAGVPRRLRIKTFFFSHHVGDVAGPCIRPRRPPVSNQIIAACPGRYEAHDHHQPSALPPADDGLSHHTHHPREHMPGTRTSTKVGETNMADPAPEQASKPTSKRRRFLNLMKRREPPSLNSKPATPTPGAAAPHTPPASPPPRTHPATATSAPAATAQQQQPTHAAAAAVRARAPARSPTPPRSSTASWTWSSPSPRQQQQHPVPGGGGGGGHAPRRYARSTSTAGGSPLASPASSLIFERSVADGAAAAARGDDRIPAALEAGSRAVVDAGVGVGDVRVVTSASAAGPAAPRGCGGGEGGGRRRVAGVVRRRRRGGPHAAELRVVRRRGAGGGGGAAAEAAADGASAGRAVAAGKRRGGRGREVRGASRSKGIRTTPVCCSSKEWVHRSARTLRNGGMRRRRSGESRGRFHGFFHALFTTTRAGADASRAVAQAGTR